MIFGWFGLPAMGIAGAAYAAVIAQIAAASLLLTTTTQILTGFLQALGRGTDSFIIAVSQAVFLLLSAWLLSLSGSAVLVWLAFPIMEILRFFIGAFMVRKTYKKQIAAI